MIFVIYYYQFCFQRATGENTFHSNWCHPLKIKVIIIVQLSIEHARNSSRDSQTKLIARSVVKWREFRGNKKNCDNSDLLPSLIAIFLILIWPKICQRKKSHRFHQLFFLLKTYTLITRITIVSRVGSTLLQTIVFSGLVQQYYKNLEPFCRVQFNINHLLGFAKTAKYTFTPCIKGKCGKFDRAMAKRVSKAIFSEERKPRASKEEKEEEWSPGRGD